MTNDEEAVLYIRLSKAILKQITTYSFCILITNKDNRCYCFSIIIIIINGLCCSINQAQNPNLT